MGRKDEAIEHYQALLRLNPDDTQGVRYVCLIALLAAGRDVEAGALLARYPDDADTLWCYGAALWAYRQEGDGRADASGYASHSGAIAACPLISRALGTGRVACRIRMPRAARRRPRSAPPQLEEAWHATAGSEDWLRRRAALG